MVKMTNDPDKIIESLEEGVSYMTLSAREDGNIQIFFEGMTTQMACSMIKVLIGVTEEELGGLGKFPPELEIARHAIEKFEQRVSEPVEFLRMTAACSVSGMNPNRRN